MPADIEDIAGAVREEAAFVRQVIAALETVIVGQQYLIDRILVALLTNGHILLEGVPGLAKTLSVKSLARSIDARFQRIQFTPDLLPADLIGTLIYNPRDGDFTTRKGPIFANLVLADEINRARRQGAQRPARGHAGAPGDHRRSHLSAAHPFLVMATQNPIEQEGTYPLPEAQSGPVHAQDRNHYPTHDDERGS